MPNKYAIPSAAELAAWEALLSDVRAAILPAAPDRVTLVEVAERVGLDRRQLWRVAAENRRPSPIVVRVLRAYLESASVG